MKTVTTIETITINTIDNNTAIHAAKPAHLDNNKQAEQDKLFL